MNDCKFFGKYRGKVESNFDPSKLGRIQVSVPAVLGDWNMSWAMPCVPFAGKDVGFFAIPPVGASVWVEFEGGDPEYPIWTGCFWGDKEKPAGQAETKIFKTLSGSITMDDIKGITIESALGMKISITASGIELKNGTGSIMLEKEKVLINKDALVVE